MAIATPSWTPDAILIVAAYLIGAVPFGYLIARAVGRLDIRSEGSGNIGATNVGRVLGVKWGIVVFVLDVLKGFLPVLAAEVVFRPGLVPLGLRPTVVAVGLATIAGHNWPIYLRFKGGKGVATSCGVFAALFPLGLAVSLAVWILVVAVTRYVSVGSMLGGLALFGAACLLRQSPFGEGKFLTAFTALAALLSIIRHRGNIARLLKGAEHKIGARRKT